MYGWSGLMPAVQSAFDIGSASASMVFSFGLVSFTFGVLIGPCLCARLPLRAQLPAIAGIAAASLALSVQTQVFDVFLLTYGIGFGFAAGALYNYALAIASASALPNLLVPISVAAFGLGGAVFGPMNVWLTGLGWSLYSVLPALGCMVLAAGMAALVKPVGGSIAIKGPSPSGFVKPDRTIFVLWAVFATGSCTGLIVLGLAPKLLPSDAMIGTMAGLAVFGVAIGNTLGRLSATGISSRYGALHGIVGAVLLSISASCALMVASSSLLIVTLLFLVALSYGQIAAQTPLLVSAHVPAPAFSGAFGWVFTGWGVAGLLGPWSAGWLLDKTGDLRLALVACVGLLVLCLWLVTRLPPPIPAAYPK